jgi:hypothetical protein
MKSYKEFLNESSKIKEYKESELSQYYISYRYNINDEEDEIDMESGGNGVLTNLNRKDLEKYIEKEWEVEDISIEKRNKDEGYISFYIIK